MANKVTNQENKEMLRRNILRERSLITANTIIKKSLKICKNISELDIYKKAKNIGIYYPINGEVDLMQLLKISPYKSFLLQLWSLL